MTCFRHDYMSQRKEASVETISTHGWTEFSLDHQHDSHEHVDLNFLAWRTLVTESGCIKLDTIGFKLINRSCISKGRERRWQHRQELIWQCFKAIGTFKNTQNITSIIRKVKYSFFLPRSLCNTLTVPEGNRSPYTFYQCQYKSHSWSSPHDLSMHRV